MFLNFLVFGNKYFDKGPVCLFTVFENRFLFSKIRRTRKQGERVWFRVCFCSEKHRKHKKHKIQRAIRVFKEHQWFLFLKIVLENIF